MSQPLQMLHIVTHGRSGSTLLTAILNALPGFQISGENKGFMHSLFLAWRSLAERDTMPSGPLDPFRCFGAFREADFFEECKSLLLSLLAPSADTNCVGFKEIRYTPADIPDDAEFTEYLHFLTALHPGSKLLFLTRDIYAVSKSKWWAEMPDAKEQITKTQDRFRMFHTANPNVSHILDYGEVVANSEGLQRLFAWLGVESPAADALSSVFEDRYAQW